MTTPTTLWKPKLHFDTAANRSHVTFEDGRRNRGSGRIRLPASVSDPRMGIAAVSVMGPVPGPTENGVGLLHHSRRERAVEARRRRCGIGLMKNTTTNLGFASEIPAAVALTT